MRKLMQASVLMLSSLLVFPAMAQEPDFAHISVVGHGEVKAKPDMAEFSVSVETLAKKPEDAKKQADKVVADFLAKLAKQGVNQDQIQSSNLMVQPRYNYSKDNERKLVGYVATRQVTVTVTDLDKLSSLLNIALTQGFNQVSNVQLKSSKADDLQQQARQQAIANAKMLAADIAKGFGQEVDGFGK